MAEWSKAKFREDIVWAEVDGTGRPLEREGFVAICYKPGGKAYKTRPDRLTLLGEPSESFQLTNPTSVSSKPKSLTFAGLKGEDVVIQLWTDGACTGNPGPAGAGVLIRHKGQEREISEFLGQGTNNIAELTAILLGLQAVDTPDVPVQVITDSSYSIGLLTKGWKPKANQELVASLRKEVQRFGDLTFVKVKGHAGIDGNERADELARAAIENQL